MVLGGIWVALNYPAVFLAALAVSLGFAAWFIAVFARFVRQRFVRPIQPQDPATETPQS
jgi:uncharacterized membrane protein